MSKKPTAAKLNPKIFVEPTALYFPPPLNRNIINTVTVCNSTAEPCVFKVHSFEPELYTVKPSAAVLAANAACRVQITLRKMKVEPGPEQIAELNKKQKFKVRAKTVPAAIYAQIAKDASSSSGGEVWRQCEAEPYAMDAILNCSFNGDVAPGATVTFESGEAAAVRAATAAAASSAQFSASSTAGQQQQQRSDKIVSFGQNAGSTSPNPNGSTQQPVKSSLKGGAGEVVQSESDAIKTNTAAKQAVSGAVGDLEAQKIALEKEIQARQALLESLKKADASAAAKKTNGSSSGKKKGGMSLSIVLILMILCYVLGSIARVKLGGAYIDSIIPPSVREVVSSTKATLDDVSINVLSAAGVGGFATGVAASDAAPAVTEKAPEVAPTEAAKATEVEVPVATEEVAEDSAKKIPEPEAAPSSSESAGDSSTTNANPEKKKKRRKKVKKD